MQGNDEAEIAQTMTGPLPCFTLWEEVSLYCKLPCAAFTHKLVMQWEKRKTGLFGKYHFLLLVCRPVLVISTPLQPFLNVNSGNQDFLMVALP